MTQQRVSTMNQISTITSQYETISTLDEWPKIMHQCK